jgi:predicted transcriptional regulator
MAYSPRVLELLRRVRNGRLKVNVDDATAVDVAREAEQLGLVAVISRRGSMRAQEKPEERPANMVVTGLTRLGERALETAN